MEQSHLFYEEKQKEFSDKLSVLRRKIWWLGWYRFLSFAAIFIPYFIWGLTVFCGAISFVCFVSFLFLIKVNVRLENKKKKTAILKKMTEDELLALQHSFLHFPNGKEYLDTEHFYSYDLDIFGDGSLFQFLNRTTTLDGKNKLAGLLKSPLRKKSEIEQRQEAVRELAKIPEWRINFRAEGKLFEETEEVHKEIREWYDTNLSLKNPKKMAWTIRIVPLFTLLALIPAALGITNAFLVLFVLIQWLFTYFYRKQISSYYRIFGRKSELLSKYMALLELLEQKNFKATSLCTLQQQLQEPSACKILRQLKKRVKKFEYRQNLIVGFVLNSIFLWDIRCVFHLWQWHGKYKNALPAWLDVIAEADTLISLSNYAFNHPSYTFPEIINSDFVYSVQELGHPLLHPQKCVCNNFELKNWSTVQVVTGANMAGKSTFLRTVGVNLLLSMTGAPVCAKKMQITPVDIYTNMRTTDSLLKDESYFFAELRRIKTVLDRLQRGERYFVILDEMLKGTNSVDKLSGSKELVRKLVQLKAVSLIATHDLKLSEMEKEFPQQVSNKCFEIKIENDELVFDYKLSDGVTQTMNATFLMKKMGII